jgi:hypothetical protein
MIRKVTIEQEVRVCDVCEEPKDNWSVSTRLPNCYICGRELCFNHTKRIGDLAFCPEHHKDIWDVIRKIKKQYDGGIKNEM